MVDIYDSVGTIRLFPFYWVPEGWLGCDGATVSDSRFRERLAMAFGRKDGKTASVKVPKLDPPTPGLRYCICVEGEWYDGVLSEDYLGSIKLFPATAIPTNYLTCDGRLLEGERYNFLRVLIGSTFGGEEPNVALPNLKAPLPDFVYAIAVENARWPAPNDWNPENELVGTISLFAFTSIPQDYRPCDGSRLPVKGNEMLASVFKDRFGGDVYNVFDTPKLEAPLPGLTYYFTTRGIYPSPP